MFYRIRSRLRILFYVFAVYQMAPRSWRPDSSLADNVPEELVQIEPIEDPLAVPMETDAIDMVMDANVFPGSTDRSDMETPTPRSLFCLVRVMGKFLSQCQHF